MATFKRTRGVGVFWDKFINGMLERGYEKDFAERCFQQIEGFGSYGFRTWRTSLMGCTEHDR